MQRQPLLKLYVPVSQDHPGVMEEMMGAHCVRASGNKHTRHHHPHLLSVE